MDTITLIDRCKNSDEAMDKLLRVIKQEHMNQRIHRYKGRNVLVEDADIESAFLFGCFQAAKEAKIDLGNPLLFILWKGQLSVQKLFLDTLKKGVRMECNECNTKAPIKSTKKRGTACAHCGSTDVKTHMIMVNEDQLQGENKKRDVWDALQQNTARNDSDLVFSQATYDIQVAEIRKRLRGRTLELFDVMVIEGINRETSDNYLAEIADRWGISTACVSIYLRKLRAAIKLYIQEG